MDLLRCPATGAPLRAEGDRLVAGDRVYRLDPESGIPLFAEAFCSPEGRAQQAHYDKVADAYVANLGYPHTQEYTRYLDEAFLEAARGVSFDRTLELCCGRGEAFRLLGERVKSGVGVDVSLSMLRRARAEVARDGITFVQADATLLPLPAETFDAVVTLGGIHHVPDVPALARQAFRVLRPGGHFVWREPVNDLFLWRWLRGVIYRLSPALDHETEHPVRYGELVPILEGVGFAVEKWRTYGFVGFCLLMNSDVLVVNRALRFVPGIRAITRAFAFGDDLVGRVLPRRGLQVVGVARKPG